MIYVREAHPGERMGSHKTIEDKIAGARKLGARYGEGAANPLLIRWMALITAPMPTMPNTLLCDPARRNGPFPLQTG